VVGRNITTVTGTDFLVATDSRQKNGLFKKVEDLHEAGASIAGERLR
jgi:hypothetical protein